MATMSARTEQRLCTQGSQAVDKTWLAESAPWLRLSPALCAATAALGAALASPPILFALAGIAFLGMILSFHPFDLIYNYGIRFLVRKRPLPPNGTPRRLACGIASVWLLVTALLFSAGDTTAGYALGILFVAVAGLVATTDICIPSILFQFFAGLIRGARNPVNNRLL